MARVTDEALRKRRRWPDRRGAVEAVCARVAAGERVGAVCARPDMPPLGTLHAWLGKDPSLKALYETARQEPRQIWARLEPPPGTGRPRLYSPRLGERVCQAIAEGEGLERVCAGPGMPSATTVYRWIRAHAEFRELYAIARAAQRDRLIDEVWDMVSAATPQELAMAQRRFAALRSKVGRLAPLRWSVEEVLPEAWTRPVRVIYENAPI